MDEPYWRSGLPVFQGMLPLNTDLCDACGVCRDRHTLFSPCRHPNGYRRCIGPRITETNTQDGETVRIHQPASPGEPIQAQ